MGGHNCKRMPRHLSLGDDIFCSGKIFYELDDYRREKKIKNVKIVRNFFPKYKGRKKKKKTYNVFFVGRLVPDKDPVFFLKNCYLKSHYVLTHL